MSKLSKRMKEIRSKVDPVKQYRMDDAITLLQNLSKVKFKEGVDLSVNLGVDPKKSEQAVRGAIVMPKGTGRNVRVAVFAEDPHATIAKEAGADLVGFEDLAQSIKKGEIDFDVLIATPDAMKVVGQLGQVLGPRGLMPNPKIGTVTQDIKTAVQNAKGGQVRYKTDKGGIVHCTVGKIDFSAADLKENILALLSLLKKTKPPAAKGVYMKNITLSSTMGPGITIDQTSISV